MKRSTIFWVISIIRTILNILAILLIMIMDLSIEVKVLLMILSVSIFESIDSIMATGIFSPEELSGENRRAIDDGYQFSDKVTDILLYSIIFIIACRMGANTPIIVLYKVLFIYRLVGVVLYMATHKRYWLIFFPNFIAMMPLLLITFIPAPKSYPRFFTILGIILFGLGCIFNILQEVYMHYIQLQYNISILP